jgi:hypothetical protein
MGKGVFRISCFNPGGVTEWSMVTVLKTVVAQATVGSNPTPSAYTKNDLLVGFPRFHSG